MKISILFFMLFSFQFSYAQSIDQPWKQELKEAVDAFVDCQHSSGPSCHAFIGRTLKTVYQADDFYSTREDRYMRVDEICDYLQRSSRWTLIGKGYEPDALEKAQAWANQKKAVVAVYLNEARMGHLAYILPGQLEPSGSWGMAVPNSAAYFLSEPGKSYVNKGLSYSFPRRIISKVHLYVRSQ